jgi:hypothetical protein
MSWIGDLAEYIRAYNVPGIGQNVFVYTLKANDYGAMLMVPNPGIRLDKDIPNYYKGRLELVVRSNSPADTETQAQAISDLLSSAVKRTLGQDVGIDLPSGRFNYIYPGGLPLIYPRTDGDFYEGAVIFDVCFAAVM